MQYELYSRDEHQSVYYHITTNDIKTILFYMLNNDSNHNYIIIDNYEVFPINYRLLGFKKMPTEDEHRKLVFECKQNKYVDFYIEQGAEQENIPNLAIKSAKDETDFYFMRLHEFDEEW